MKPACTSSECGRFAHSMDPYVDGELDPGHVIDVESHVFSCPSCSERVAMARAVRHSLKRQAPAVTAPAALRASLCARMAAEREQVQAETEAIESVVAERESMAQSPKLIRGRYAAALAAAAGIVFAIGMSKTQRTPSLSFADASTPQRVMVGLDTMLDELVALHADPLPPEMTNPEELPRFDPLVGVPVRRPAFLPVLAQFKGARVNSMKDHRTALLQYTVEGGHRVTIYVFDSRSAPVQEATRLRPRLVRERAVYVAKLRGYSVAALEQGGVGYALASDLDDDASARMMASVVQ